MEEKVALVIGTVRTLTRENTGVVIDPLDSEDGILRIRYYEGTNDDCPECVMPPDSFRDMVERMCRVQAPHITRVELVPAR